MTISANLFRAVLAMDAYNRGYDAGIAGLGGIGATLGNATFIEHGAQIAGPAIDQHRLRAP